jgi:hypothetical protein
MRNYDSVLLAIAHGLETVARAIRATVGDSRLADEDDLESCLSAEVVSSPVPPSLPASRSPVPFSGPWEPCSGSYGGVVVQLRRYGTPNAPVFLATCQSCGATFRSSVKKETCAARAGHSC